MFIQLIQHVLLSTREIISVQIIELQLCEQLPARKINGPRAQGPEYRRAVNEVNITSWNSSKISAMEKGTYIQKLMYFCWLFKSQLIHSSYSFHIFRSNLRGKKAAFKSRVLC